MYGGEGSLSFLSVHDSRGRSNPVPFASTQISFHMPCQHFQGHLRRNQEIAREDSLLFVRDSRLLLLLLGKGSWGSLCCMEDGLLGKASPEGMLRAGNDGPRYTGGTADCTTFFSEAPRA